MRVALFGGSFDPVHTEHVRYALAAKEALGLDLLIVMPAGQAPHKKWGAVASGKERLEMCRIAFLDYPWVKVSDEEVLAQGASYSYLTCRAFAKQYPGAERFFLVGADMLENFFSWKFPDDILSNVTLVACGRGEENPEVLRERFFERFGKSFVSVPFQGDDVASRLIRVDLAFEKEPCGMHEDVLSYIREKGLYSYAAIAPALSLEKQSRREHSYRVARMAVARATQVGVAEEKALLAAALHDCGKYVALDSPLLSGFVAPQDVPAPVMHQYTGAYLAREQFQIDDEEIVDAIRYHTSARAGMSTLEKLIYLADMLEDGRDFEGVNDLRKLFWQDLDECLFHALSAQEAYLKETNKPVYPLTHEALLWISDVIKLR